MTDRGDAGDERFRAIVRQSPMGMHLYELTDDDRLVLIDANPAADRMTGIVTSTLFGKTIEEAFPPLAATEVPGRYRRAARDGESWSTIDLHYSDGAIKGVFDVHAFQVSPGRMAVMFVDITRRYEDERERLRLEQQLAQVQKMDAVGRLAGGVAHDFNNMLQAIKGYNELARMSLPNEGPVAEYLNEVARASERATALVRQLLTFSRREAYEPEYVDVGALATEAARMLERLLGEHIALRVEHAPVLPTIHADPVQIEQVLLNLCINARDAMPQGGSLTVTATAVERDRHFCAAHPPLEPGRFVRLSVTDDGSGMDDDVVPHIFEPFFTTKPEGSGTGLGLATVYAIVHRHGGAIEVRTRRGMGTTFDVYFPVAEGALTAEQVTAAEPQTAGAGELILVAEDAIPVAQLTTRILERAGYHTLVAHDGTKAIELFRQHADDVDLVLLDAVMPGASGRQVYDVIRAERPDVPVLFSSGFSFDVLHQGHVPAGSIELLHKPFQVEELLGYVRRLLGARKKKKNEQA